MKQGIIFAVLVATMLAQCNGAEDFSERPDGNNVARFKQVDVSRINNANAASKAVDGSGNPTFGANGNCWRSVKNEVNPWVRIDLGGSYLIHGVEIFTSTKEGGSLTAAMIADRKKGDQNLEVRIGDEKDNFVENPKCFHFGNPYVERHEVGICEKPICGRYISIQRTSMENVAFYVCEFLAFTMDIRNECTNEAEVATDPPTVPTDPPTVPTVPTEPPTVPTEPPTVPTEAPTVPTEAPTVPTTTTTEAPVDVCELGKGAGSCDTKEERFFYKADKMKCFPMMGCADGVENMNNFASQEDCENTCEMRQLPEECLMPMDSGSCDEKEVRYFFKNGTCKKFQYSGCGGNANNFESKKDCAKYCK